MGVSRVLSDFSGVKLSDQLMLSSCPVVVYVLVFMGNYQLTGKWPYAFMDATWMQRLGF